MNEDSSRPNPASKLEKKNDEKSKATARLTQRRLFERIVGWQNQPSGRRLDATKIQYYITVNPTTHIWKLKGVKEITAKQNN